MSKLIEEIDKMSDRQVQNQILIHSIQQTDSLNALRRILNFFLFLVILPVILYVIVAGIGVAAITA